MLLRNGVLNVESSSTGAIIHSLQMGNRHFLFPRQFVQKNDGNGNLLRGGMHLCSPVFGSAIGKGRFSQAPQHGELRDLFWDEEKFSETGISYTIMYEKWGAWLSYGISYILEGNRLTTCVNIRNWGSEINEVEFGWHPYFNAPQGGKIVLAGEERREIEINDPFGPEIFPASHMVMIDLPEIGMVSMILEDGFRDGYVCIWTDWSGKYFCVEPLLTYKKFGPGVAIEPQESISAKMMMIFN